MLRLSQRDPRWSQVKIGYSALTMGRFGCTTTCISMLTDYFKRFVAPDAIAKDGKNYTEGGLIVWKNLHFPTMQFGTRLYGENTMEINESLKHPDKAVILQVNGGQHWVVAISKTWFGNDYVCIDTWDGKKKSVKKSYRNITGSAHFFRK